MQISGNLNHLLHMLEVVRRIVGKGENRDIFALCRYLPSGSRHRYQTDLILLAEIARKLKDISFPGGIVYGQETVKPSMPTPDTAFLQNLVEQWQKETGLSVAEAVIVNRHLKDGETTRTWIERKTPIDKM